MASAATCWSVRCQLVRSQAICWTVAASFRGLDAGAAEASEAAETAEAFGTAEAAGRVVGADDESVTALAAMAAARRVTPATAIVSREGLRLNFS